MLEEIKGATENIVEIEEKKKIIFCYNCDG